MKELLAIEKEQFQIDKGSWEIVRFGDVAIQQKKSVNREKTNLSKYVKGEHMYSEDLHLREWGELTDEYLGPAFIRYFEKGDILYGSRRTYLRKVVIAPFEGITSNTTFVIKANEKKIDSRLLPFVMMSEGFTENSIRNSKGSVNPYINWKDIANYEFLLPPKAQQAQLAELLWAMDEVIEKEKGMLEKQKQLKKSLMRAFFMKGIGHTEFKDSILGRLPINWEVANFESIVADMKSGLSRRIVAEDIGVPVLISGNIQDDKLDISELKYWYRDDPQGANVSNYILKEGDILLCFINSLVC